MEKTKFLAEGTKEKSKLDLQKVDGWEFFFNAQINNEEGKQ